jgi:hypothetical protein
VDPCRNCREGEDLHPKARNTDAREEMMLAIAMNRRSSR